MATLRVGVGCVILGFFLVSVTGCEQHLDAKASQRIHNNLDVVTYSYFHEKSWTHSGVKNSFGNVLVGLVETSAKNFSSPRVCDARFYYYTQDASNHSYFVIYWIQDYPTPDKARIFWESGLKKDIPISHETIMYNREVAERAVVYDARFSFDVSEWQEIREQSQPQAILLVGDEPVSNAFPVAWVQNAHERPWNEKEPLQDF